MTFSPKIFKLTIILMAIFSVCAIIFGLPELKINHIKLELPDTILKVASNNPSKINVPPQTQFENAQVKRVVDGDTIELTDGRKIRYIGINTPETVDPRRPVGCFGHEASLANQELVNGKEVRLEKDVSETDKYNRLLRYVFVGDLMVNEELVKKGYATVETVPPDVKYADKFLIAARNAKNSNVGLWGSCQGE